MSSKTIKGIVTVALVGAAVYATYHFAMQTKRGYARVIAKNGGAANAIGLMVLEEAFLKEWAYAIRKGKASFEYKGKQYNTVGGKVIQKTA